MTTYEGLPLKLTQVFLRNIRCFEELKIDLRTEEGLRTWVVVFGDNGVGKTTLLRSIAMGLCDDASASGLLREIPGDWNRLVDGAQQEGLIELTFDSEHGPAKISTIIEPRGSGYTRVRQTADFNGNPEFPWDAIFACGYSSRKRAPPPCGPLQPDRRRQYSSRGARFRDRQFRPGLTRRKCEAKRRAR